MRRFVGKNQFHIDSRGAERFASILSETGLHDSRLVFLLLQSFGRGVFPGGLNRFLNRFFPRGV